MPDSIKTVLNGIEYTFIKLKPFHFLELEGLPFDTFDTSQKETGVYAQMYADLEGEEETNKEQIDIKKVKQVLDLAVIDFDADETEEHEGEEILRQLFNTVLYYSLETFKKVIKPNNQMLVNFHYLAKNYGNDPIYYASQPMDHFLFNIHSLSEGVKDEATQAKKAQKKARRR